MVPAGTEPHDWEPAVSDIRNLEEADLFVYSGRGWSIGPMMCWPAWKPGT